MRLTYPRIRCVWTVWVLATLALLLAHGAHAQPFTYQGLLKDGGNPANGTYPMTFRLYDAAAGGNLLGTVGPTNVLVSNGLFTVSLAFPASVWDGGVRYLEIQVGGTTLAPRVRINPTPYASALRLFESGTSNPDRMVIAHSPAFTDWGLQYQDVGDKFNFLANGTPVMTVDLGRGRVGIGADVPEVRLHIEGGSDAAPAGGGYLQLGPTSGANLSIDSNEIMARANGSPSTLYLNNDGGDVSISPNAPSGKLGVGTDAPEARLHVVTDTLDEAIYAVNTTMSGKGVYGRATHPFGVNYGGYFQTDSTSGIGVAVITTSTVGETYGVYVENRSQLGKAVFGWATTLEDYATVGVLGRTSSVHGYGVRGEEPDGGSGHAVYAKGSFAATGTKSFQIDHPLRPETHFLNHFCTEGPEPYNVYRGTVVLDARGEAWVQLPDYFGAINRDPSYHLTPIGAPMPNLHVAVEIQGDRFKIAGGVPGAKVSWEVKAVRNDPWVQRYGYQTEQEKPAVLKGRYLNPELYGQPKELGIFDHP